MPTLNRVKKLARTQGIIVRVIDHGGTQIIVQLMAPIGKRFKRIGANMLVYTFQKWKSKTTVRAEEYTMMADIIAEDLESVPYNPLRQ
jgi:hypothetical protein